LIVTVLAIAVLVLPSTLRAAPRRRGGAQVVFDTRISASDAEGEPEIAADHRDPHVIVAIYKSGASVSRDGGHHWRQFDSWTSNDVVATSDRVGRLYYATMAGTSYTFMRSTNNGRSWQVAGNPLRYPLAANQSLSETIQPTDGPVYMGPAPIGCDRPLSGADLNTGALFASCADHGDQSGGERGQSWEAFFATCRANLFSGVGMSNCGRRYVSVSHDHGGTWTDWLPEDSADYPAGYTGAFGGIPVGAHGVLATAYVAGAAPGSDCTQCAVFETSRDDGRTWSRHLVPGVTPQIKTLTADNATSFFAGTDPHDWVAQFLAVDNQSVWFEPYVAADPSTAGRYAIMVLDGSRTELLVYQTKDSGRSWTGPVVLGDGIHRVDKPAMAYGPLGALGVVWKSVYGSDLSFDVWAAASPGGSLPFGHAVRLDSRRSHEETCGSDGAEGEGYACDEMSWLVVDRGALDAVWGDNRDGQHPWFGRYVFSADPQFRAR